MRNIKILALMLVLPVLLTACAHSGGARFGHYSQAEKYYAEGKFDQAVAEYAEYLKQEPDGNMAIIAHYYTAKSLAAMGNTEGAKAGFQNVIDKYPKSDWASFAKDRLEELAAGQ